MLNKEEEKKKKEENKAKVALIVRSYFTWKLSCIFTSHLTKFNRYMRRRRRRCWILIISREESNMYDSNMFVMRIVLYARLSFIVVISMT